MNIFGMYVYVYAYLFVQMEYMYACMYVSMHACMYVCMYVCMYGIHIRYFLLYIYRTSGVFFFLSYTYIHTYNALFVVVRLFEAWSVETQR